MAKNQPVKNPRRVMAFSLELTRVGWLATELELEGDRVVERRPYQPDVGVAVMSKLLLWWQRVTGNARELPALEAE